MKNNYLPQKFKVIDFHRETPDNFTITINMKTISEPGQFVQISIPGIGECPISICSNSKKNIKLK